MLIIPTEPNPGYTFRTRLNDQDVGLRIYQKSTGLYIDVILDTVAIVTGVLCRNRVITIRQEYLGFEGDLVFVDTQGNEDPYYTGLGERFKLVYSPRS